MYCGLRPFDQGSSSGRRQRMRRDHLSSVIMSGVEGVRIRLTLCRYCSADRGVPDRDYERVPPSERAISSAVLE